MNKNIIFAACLSAALASCNQVEVPEYQPMSLDIAVTTVAETKGLVTGTTLPSGSSVGLFVTDQTGITYDGVEVSNVKYTAAGEGASQTWSAVSDIMLSGTKGTLKGYYPYSESVTDITAIPVEATSEIQNDWMWATPIRNLNYKYYNATVKMNHALAAVRLSVIRKTATDEAEITSITFKSDAAAREAVLNATNGALSSISGTGAKYTASETFTASDTKKSFDFITVPAGVSAPIAVELTVNGSMMSAESDPVLLEAGNLYEYTLVISINEGLSMNTLNVTEWSTVENEELVELGPKTITIPDPYVEWARIQHVDGTLYTAEEWLAAETAGTVTDADANGVAVLYSKYAVCPHVIHPKYATNKNQWSSNTSVEVPEVPLTSNLETAKLDVNGQANTDAILTAVVTGTIADALAAQCCAETIFANGQQGYLPAMGEIQAWRDNETVINACMNAIAADQVNSYPKKILSSTQYSASQVWYWDSANNGPSNYPKDAYNSVRPVSDFSL